MLYGIGTRSLGEALGVEEREAAAFLSDFRSAYPGVQRFVERTVADCRKSGYVETMGGRRRHLPGITGDASHFARAAAERQAVNTAVQGSAADLVKAAMAEIDRRVFEAFPQCARPLRPSRRPQPGDRERGGGAYFLLQMHDELLYEVDDFS